MSQPYIDFAFVKESASFERVLEHFAYRLTGAGVLDDRREIRRVRAIQDLRCGRGITPRFDVGCEPAHTLARLQHTHEQDE